MMGLGKCISGFKHMAILGINSFRFQGGIYTSKLRNPGEGSCYWSANPGFLLLATNLTQRYIQKLVLTCDGMKGPGKLRVSLNDPLIFQTKKDRIFP